MRTNTANRLGGTATSGAPDSACRAAGYRAKTAYVGDAAQTYDERRTHSRTNRRRWRSEIDAVDGMLRALPRARRVLDIPCGTGRLFHTLLQYEHRVTGADISEDMLALANQRADAETGQVYVTMADAERLPFRDQEFDYTVCMRFLNIVPPAVRKRVVREMARVTRAALLLEVRVRTVWSIRGDLLRGLIGAVSAMLRRSAEAQGHSVGHRPQLHEIVDQLKSCGWEISGSHRIWWGRTLSPMLLLVFTRIASAPPLVQHDEACV